MQQALLTLVFVALPLGVAPARAQQPDTVILRSGNPVIGEVKSLLRGSLAVDTDEMDIVNIDWDHIAFVTSAQFFEVELVSGEQLYGSLTSPDSAVLVVVGTEESDTTSFRDVIEIRPIESGFWARTNGFIDLGSNVARANQLSSILITGQFSYRGPTWGFDVNGESYLQRQESVTEAGDTTIQRTSRASFSWAVNRFLGGKWAIIASAQVEHNQELSLDRRLLWAVGGAYEILNRPGMEFRAGAGGTVNDERYSGEAQDLSGEFLVATGFDAYDVGDIGIYTTLTTYTSPGDGGRFRINFDGRIAWEIISNFTIGLNVIERYDSNPPSVDAANRDYQYAVSIGWSWS